MARRPKRISGVLIATELHALAVEMLRQRLRREHPRWSPAMIEAEVSRWQNARPGAEHGDSPGQPVALPRRRRR